MEVQAYISRDAVGTHRIFCKRGKYKWWFELGQHRETDIAFQKALASGKVQWRDKIQDSTQLF